MMCSLILIILENNEKSYFLSLSNYFSLLSIKHR